MKIFAKKSHSQSVYRVCSWGFIAVAAIAHFIDKDQPAAYYALAMAGLNAVWELAGTVNSASPDSEKKMGGTS